VGRFGANPALLVKLLDAGQRLPVHVHPDRRFATTHLASGSARPRPGSCSTPRPTPPSTSASPRRRGRELARWVVAQDVATLLGTTIASRSGPATRSSARPGCPTRSARTSCSSKLQEPTDFSVLLEWDGFPLGPRDATLGLSFDEALACVDRRACRPVGWPSSAAARRRAASGAAQEFGQPTGATRRRSTQASASSKDRPSVASRGPSGKPSHSSNTEEIGRLCSSTSRMFAPIAWGSPAGRGSRRRPDRMRLSCRAASRRLVPRPTGPVPRPRRRG